MQSGLDNSDASKIISWDAWVAQSVEWLTLAQIMISRFMGSSPALDSVLTAQSLEHASDSVSLLLSLPLPCLHSQKWIKVININKNKNKNKKSMVGAPKWLSWLRVWLQLRPRSHGSWARAPPMLAFVLTVQSLLQILCLPLSAPVHSSVLSLKNKHKKNE